METIELVNDGSGLGFGIIGGKATGVIVKTILPGGVADQVSCCSMSSMAFKELIFKIYLLKLPVKNKLCP